jgi:DNA invertase Pin-like site-specific DNA recombinase
MRCGVHGMTRSDPWQVYRLELAAALTRLQRALAEAAPPAPPAPPRVGGRPRIDPSREAAVRALLAEGVAVNRIAKAIGVGAPTVMRIKREMAAASCLGNR